MQYTFKKTNISPELKAFFKAMQEWIDADFEYNKYLDPDYGLCANLHDFNLDCYYTYELIDLFKENSLNTEYPFNAGGFSTYDAEEHYTNPMRLAFIKFYSED